MSTKELSKTKPLMTRNFFDFPASMDWLEEFVPRGLFFHNPEWKSIKIEEFMKDGKLIVRAEMPGLDPDKDIDVSMHDGYLTIQGERQEEFRDDHRCEFSYGSFSRSVALPTGAVESSIHAEYKDGILEVSVDVPHKTSNHKKIPIAKAKS